MRISPWTWFAAIAAGLVGSSPAGGQRLFGHAESLESMVANADRLIVGKLVAIGDAERGDGPPRTPATIDVEASFKADLFATEPDQRLQVNLLTPHSDLASWKDHAHRLLVAIGEDQPNAATVIPLVPERLEVLTADFQLLRDLEAVIRAAREAARRVPAPVRRLHTFRLRVPRAVVAGTRWESFYETGGWLVLSVPADARLEARARDALQSDAYLDREEAARALRYFPSEENTARLKRLWNDPGWAYLRHAEENHGIEVRVYGVRREAYETLKSWGVNADKPTTREEVRK